MALGCSFGCAGWWIFVRVCVCVCLCLQRATDLHAHGGEHGHRGGDGLVNAQNARKHRPSGQTLLRGVRGDTLARAKILSEVRALEQVGGVFGVHLGVGVGTGALLLAHVQGEVGGAVGYEVAAGEESKVEESS